MSLSPHNIFPAIRRALAVGGGICVLIFLIGVRPPASGRGDKPELEVWYAVGSEEDDLPEIVWFNEAQSRLRARGVGLPFLQIEQKFLTSVVGEVAPDVFEYFGSVAQWSSRGALLPLDEYMRRDGFDRESVFPALWEEMIWDGRTFAIPLGTSCDAFYWNKQHFREAGLDPDRPPLTWKELEDYALRLSHRDGTGALVRPGYIPGYWRPTASPLPLFIFWPLELGARFLSEDGSKVDLSSQACVEALEWEASLFQRLGGEELLSLQASFGYGKEHGFLGGKVSMIAQKSSFIGELAKFSPELDYGCSTFPAPEGRMPATVSGSVWIGIPAGCKNPDAAWEYIRFVAQPSVQERAARYAVENNRVGFFPANIEVARSPIQMTIPFMQVFIDSMQYAHTPTIVPLAHVVFWREYAIAWESAIRGARKPAEALRSAEAQVQRTLDAQLAYERFARHKKQKEHAEGSL